MKELQSLSWYAARIKPHLPKEAFKPAPSRLLRGLLFLVIAILGAVAIGTFDLGFWANLAIAFVLGSCFASLGLLGHEILHGAVVRKPWLRDLLGAICLWPLCTGPSLWRKWHNMKHHVHTQDEGKDPDAWPSINQLASAPFIVRLAYKFPLFIRSVVSFSFLAVTFTLHSTRMFMVYLSEFKSKEKPKVFLQLIIPWATWIGLLFWVGVVKWIFIFLIPLLIANTIVMAYIATNHRLNPLVPVNDPLANSLTVTVPKWVDFLHFDFSLHTEHHLFPTMNPKYYRLVREQILRMWPDRYHEMPFGKALLALWKTPRVYHQKNHLVDPEPGNVYDTLGHGLNPDHIEYRKEDIGYNDKIELATQSKNKSKDV